MSAAKLARISASAKKAVKESFPQYLRRVGADYAESGAEFTAEDYRNAAKRIEDLEFELALANSKLAAQKAKGDVVSIAHHVPMGWEDAKQFVRESMARGEGFNATLHALNLQSRLPFRSTEVRVMWSRVKEELTKAGGR